MSINKTARPTTRRLLHSALALGLAGIGAYGVSAQVVTPSANPNGAVFDSPNANTTNITAPNNAVIEYNQFNIGVGQTVEFIQPSADSRVLNRITGALPSLIEGSLVANGIVYLVNPAGVTFANGSVTNVGGLYAAAGSITDSDFQNGIDNFTGMANDTTVAAGAAINIAGEGGFAVLLGDTASNFGTITAPKGAVALLSGTNFLVTHMDGRRGLVFAQITTPNGNASDQSGTVNTDIQMTNDAAGVVDVQIVAGDLFGVIALGADAEILTGGTAAGANQVNEDTLEAQAALGNRILVSSVNGNVTSQAMSDNRLDLTNAGESTFASNQSVNVSNTTLIDSDNALAFSAGTTLTVGNATSNNGSVTAQGTTSVNAGNLSTPNGDVGFGTSTSVTAGNINTQTFGVALTDLTVGDLTVTNGGVTLNDADVTNLTVNGNISASGNVQVTRANAIALNNVESTGGSVTLDSGDTLNAGTVGASTNVTLDGDNGIDTGNVTATTGNLTINDAFSTAGSFTATAGGDITAGNVESTGGSVALDAGDELSAGTVTGDTNVTLDGDNGIDTGNVTATNGNVTINDAFSTAGSFTATAGGDITTGNVESTGGSVALDAGDELSAGTVTGDTNVTLDGDNGIDTGNVTATNGNVTINDAFSTAGSFTATAGGDVTAGNVESTGGSVALDAGDELSAGTVTGDTNVTLDGDNGIDTGNVTATNGNVTINDAFSTAGSFTATAGGDITAGNVESTGGSVALDAGDELSAGTVGASTNVTLDGDNGIDTGNITATNGSVTINDPFSADSSVTVLADTSVSFNTFEVTGAGNSATLTAGTTLAGGSVTAGNNVTLTGPNGISGLVALTDLGTVTASNGNIILNGAAGILANTLNAPNGSIDVNGPLVSGANNIQFTAGTSIETDSVSGFGGTVTLDAQGGSLTGTAIFGAGDVKLDGRGITLNSVDSSAKTTVTSETNPLNIGLVSGGGLVTVDTTATTLGNGVSTITNQVLSDNGNVVVKTGPAGLDVPAVNSPNGNITLTGLLTRDGAAENIVLNAKGTIGFTGATISSTGAGGGVSLISGGNSVTGGNIITDSPLVVKRLAADPNGISINTFTFNNLTVTNGGVTLNDANVTNLTVNGDIKTSGAVQVVRAGAVALNNVESTGSSVALDSVNNTLTAGTVKANTNVTLDGATNIATGNITATTGNVNVNDPFSTAGNVTVTAGGNVTTGSFESTGGSVALNAGANLNAGTVSASTNVTLDGDNAINTGNITATNGSVTINDAFVTSPSIIVSALNGSITTQAFTSNNGSVQLLAGTTLNSGNVLGLTDATLTGPGGIDSGNITATNGRVSINGPLSSTKGNLSIIANTSISASGATATDNPFASIRSTNGFVLLNAGTTITGGSVRGLTNVVVTAPGDILLGDVTGTNGLASINGGGAITFEDLLVANNVTITNSTNMSPTTFTSIVSTGPAGTITVTGGSNILGVSEAIRDNKLFVNNAVITNAEVANNNITSGGDILLTTFGSIAFGNMMTTGAGDIGLFAPQQVAGHCMMTSGGDITVGAVNGTTLPTGRFRITPGCITANGGTITIFADIIESPVLNLGPQPDQANTFEFTGDFSFNQADLEDMALMGIIVREMTEEEMNEIPEGQLVVNDLPAKVGTLTSQDYAVAVYRMSADSIRQTLATYRAVFNSTSEDGTPIKRNAEIQQRLADAFTAYADAGNDVAENYDPAKFRQFMVSEHDDTQLAQDINQIKMLLEQIDAMGLNAVEEQLSTRQIIQSVTPQGVLSTEQVRELILASAEVPDATEPVSVLFPELYSQAVAQR